MPRDNEHNLRRRMVKRLGRDISPAAWDVAAERLYVGEALNPEMLGGEDALLRFLSDLLRVQDDVRHKPAADAAKPHTFETKDLGARVRAMSVLAAELAAGDDEVLHFRQRILGRETPMSAEDAETYIDLRSSRWPNGHVGSTRAAPEHMSYQNMNIFLDITVWPGSPLDELRKVADGLAKSYPWEPSQAAAFVLEGLTPLAAPFMIKFPQPLFDGRPRRSRVVMEIDMWMPAQEVLSAYREIQRGVLPGHNRPVSRRAIDLVSFVQSNRPASWPELLVRWNNAHSEAIYSTYRSLRTAYDRARKSLLFPGYRWYLGPG